MSRTREQVMRDIMESHPTVEHPWSLWEKLTHALTGRVSPRIYMERMVGMERDRLRFEQLVAELKDAER